MTDLPAPPVPPECDLQDFPFMPLQVARLRDSELAAEEHPEACWYAVLLWAASWHQVPAASLPDNDLALMRLVGLGRDERTWKKHKAGALRGFVRCSDGRLYHSVVAEQAREAWESKLRQRHRTFCAAIRKHNERHPADKRDAPNFDAWTDAGRPDRVTRDTPLMSRVTDPEKYRDIGSKGQGQGQGQLKNRTEPIGSAAGAAWPDDPAPADRPPPEPVDLVKSIFDAGVQILSGAGTPPGQARSILGRWRKLHSDSAVLTVLARCQVERPQQPVEWITAALQAESRRAAGQSPSTQPQRRSLVEIARGVAQELSDDQIPRLAAN